MLQQRKKITVPNLRARKVDGPKITAVTAYDATMATLLDEAGVDVILIGDSLGMVIQGRPNTLAVTVDEICYHSRAVSRVVRFSHIVGDMPFLSCSLSVKDAVKKAGKLMQKGCCEAVKIEGGVEYEKHVRAIISAGIPVMGHVGLTPQSVHAMGGFRVQGKGEQAAERVLRDAQAFEAAGAYSVVIEGVPHTLASRITRELTIPTIGIGASAECDGQVLVCYDYLGMGRTLKPKFVKHFAEIGDAIVDATKAYIAEVQQGTFPAESHYFHDTGTKRSTSHVETPQTQPEKNRFSDAQPNETPRAPLDKPPQPSALRHDREGYGPTTDN